MRKKPVCIICREKEATVVDRNEGPFAKRKKICMDCHSERLKHDFCDILDIERRRIGNHRSPFGMGS